MSTYSGVRFFCSYILYRRLQKEKRSCVLTQLHILINLKLSFTQVYCRRVLAMRAASLVATSITADAATALMCLDNLLRSKIHADDNNKTYNPGCHIQHLDCKITTQSKSITTNRDEVEGCSCEEMRRRRIINTPRSISEADAPYTMSHFASTLNTVSPLDFLAGRNKRYRKPIKKTTATPVPKLKASPPMKTLPNW